MPGSKLVQAQYWKVFKRTTLFFWLCTFLFLLQVCLLLPQNNRWAHWVLWWPIDFGYWVSLYLTSFVETMVSPKTYQYIGSVLFMLLFCFLQTIPYLCYELFWERWTGSNPSLAQKSIRRWVIGGLLLAYAILLLLSPVVPRVQ